MKKILILLFLLTAFSLSGFSQSGIYSGGMSGIAKHDLRKTGLIVRPEMGFVYVEYMSGLRNEQFITFGADVGYQISPHIYLGGGLGCFVGLDGSYYNVNLGLLGYRDKIIPLYASFRWYWYDGLSSPFLELEAGGARGFTDYSFASFFISPAIGYDIKNFDIKISVPVFAGVIDPHAGVCATIGYNFLIKKR